MQKIILFISLILGSSVARGQEKNVVNFLSASSWQEVRDKAKIEHKNIFVDMYATWCVPCKQMDAEVYTNPEVAAFANDNFISIKVQVDQTKNDSEQVRKWYEDANKLKAQYQITAMPTFLFFSPEGQVLNRVEGFHPANEFLAVLKATADPTRNFSFYLQQWKSKTIIGKELLPIILTAKKYKLDSISNAIAKDYKKTYLDNQKPEGVLSPQLLEFLTNFYTLFNLHDKISEFLYRNPKIADSMLNNVGYAIRFVDYLISRELIDPLIKPNGLYLKTNPDWSFIQKSIAKR